MAASRSDCMVRRDVFIASVRAITVSRSVGVVGGFGYTVGDCSSMSVTALPRPVTALARSLTRHGWLRARHSRSVTGLSSRRATHSALLSFGSASVSAAPSHLSGASAPRAGRSFSREPRACHCVSPSWLVTEHSPRMLARAAALSRPAGALLDASSHLPAHWLQVDRNFFHMTEH